MLIPKSSYDQPEVKPAWLPIQDSKGNSLKPIIRCQCGELVSIRLHSVSETGEVRASFYHYWPELKEGMQQGCGFHEYLELADWNGLMFPGEA